MMSLHHGWGWQSPQINPPIHIRHIKSVWLHWYVVHGHSVASFLRSYTHTTCLRFWGSTGPLVEWKWCHYIMDEAGSHLKVLPLSIIVIEKVFEHIDMLSIGIRYQSYTVILTLLGSDLGVLGHLWSQNDVITPLLTLAATSNCFPYPYKTH